MLATLQINGLSLRLSQPKAVKNIDISRSIAPVRYTLPTYIYIYMHKYFDIDAYM